MDLTAINFIAPPLRHSCTSATDYAIDERKAWKKKILELLDDPEFREAMLSKLLQDAANPDYPRSCNQCSL